MLITSPKRQDNSYSVVNASNTDLNTVLDGFIISGGNANDSAAKAPFITSRGGGIASSMGFANITTCVITHCSALQGGGFYSINGDPNMAECTVYANASSAYGGAMWHEASHMRISQTEIKQNQSGFDSNRHR